jgi:uncharacterized protein with HEPN domain
MPKRPEHVLRHIAEAIERIEKYAAGKTLADYESNELLQGAVERWIEVISEASRSIPDDFKADHLDISWRAIAGICNLMRHGYENVRNDVIWDIVENRIPPLKRAIEAMAAKHGIDLYSDQWRSAEGIFVVGWIEAARWPKSNIYLGGALAGLQTRLQGPSA